MKLKNIDKLSAHLINYYSDDAALYALLQLKSRFSLVIYDPQSFKKVSALPVPPSALNHLTPCIDNDCIYMPSAEGQIFGNDKFSGIRLVTMNLGPMMPVTDLKQDEKCVFACCGIPIKEVSKPKTNTDLFCVVVNEKDKGKKLFQTQYFHGTPLFVKHGKYLFIAAKNELHQFTSYGELVALQKLSINCEHEPVITDNFVVCSSTLGTLEIFRKSDLTLHGRILVAKNESPPVTIHGDIMYWFAQKSVFKIDLDKMNKTEIGETETYINAMPVFVNNKMYVPDTQGKILSVDDDGIELLRVSEQSVSKLIHLDGFIFAASNNNFLQIEI